MRANRLAPSPAMTHPRSHPQPPTQYKNAVTHQLARPPAGWEDHPPAAPVTRRLGRSPAGWEDHPPAGKITHRLGRSPTGWEDHPPVGVTELRLQFPTQHCHPKPAQRHSESPLSFRIPPVISNSPSVIPKRSEESKMLPPMAFPLLRQPIA